MITANECKTAVELRNKIDLSKASNDIERAIINQVNKGWLFISLLVHNIETTADELDELDNAGFRYDNDEKLLIWM